MKNCRSLGRWMDGIYKIAISSMVAIDRWPILEKSIKIRISGNTRNRVTIRSFMHSKPILYYSFSCCHHVCCIVQCISTSLCESDGEITILLLIFTYVSFFVFSSSKRNVITLLIENIIYVMGVNPIETSIALPGVLFGEPGRGGSYSMISQFLSHLQVP